LRSVTGWWYCGGKTVVRWQYCKCGGGGDGGDGGDRGDGDGDGDGDISLSLLTLWHSYACVVI
jgi:hypothetical protein